MHSAMSKKDPPLVPVLAPPTLAPKQVLLNVKSATRTTLASKKRLLDSWSDFCDGYQGLLGYPNPPLKPSMTDFETAHSLSTRTMYELLKNETRIKMMPKEFLNTRKNARDEIRPFYPVEKVLFAQIRYLRERNVPVDQWLVQLMAKEIYDHLSKNVGALNFRKPKFSGGWVTSFKKTWGYMRHQLTGEAASVDWNAILPQVEAIKKVISEYDLDDVYNADESGLFLQSASTWTLDTQKRSGVKSSSSRVSILFCTNATGTDKRKPYILSENLPLGFRQDDALKSLVEIIPWQPKTQQSNTKVPEQPGAEVMTATEGNPPNVQATKEPTKAKKRADYMNTYTFVLWLKNFQQSIVEKNPSRHILLLLDNASCHTAALKAKVHFPNIKVVFLPPNSTSVTQPLDAGIIAVFKKRYRDLISKLVVKRHNHFVNSTTAASNDGTSSGKAAANPSDAVSSRKASSTIKVTNNEAWHFIVVAWDAVKPGSIRSCFRHVPLLCDIQKKELWPHNALEQEVVDALAVTQQNVLQQARVQGFKDAASTVVHPHIVTYSSSENEHELELRAAGATDDEDEGGSANQSTSTQSLDDIIRALGSHAQLLTEISRVLDGSPFINEVVEQECMDYKFMEKFKPFKTGAELLNEHWQSSTSEGEGTDNEDYTTNPKQRLQLTSERGSPLKPKFVRKLSRGQDYQSKIDQLASSGTSDSEQSSRNTASGSTEHSEDDKQGEESTEESRAAREQDIFLRGQIHSHLSSAAQLMTRLRKPQPSKRVTVELIADTMVNKVFTDIDNAYYVKFIQEQNRLIHAHLEKKARLTVEKKKINERFPL